ncbi:hypothetical protein PHLCEN_2v10124 [Hermanssonia centrifuga]|uniref:Uncharacterized protein n=1 Tax=Hermanssonia centrifuga TaxID=98765 RepID=A0A2R6NP12_9APHY|nr:hypothetical protein PHLCEN_2v10124 [Hermanssonia centrifuga]
MSSAAGSAGESGSSIAEASGSSGGSASASGAEAVAEEDKRLETLGADEGTGLLRGYLVTWVEDRRARCAREGGLMNVRVLRKRKLDRIHNQESVAVGVDHKEDETQAEAAADVEDESQATQTRLIDILGKIAPLRSRAYIHSLKLVLL